MTDNLTSRAPIPVRIAVLTVSDTRTEATDTSGGLLVERIARAGHTLHDKRIVPDEPAQIRAVLEAWCDADDVDVIITTGGTGVTGRDVTVDVVERLLDKPIPGFGELFRWLSYKDIGTSTLQSRVTGGLARNTFVFALPGSTGACRTGWDEILVHQLDASLEPCNLVQLIPRLSE